MHRSFRKKVWKPPVEDRDSSRSIERTEKPDLRRHHSERDSLGLNKREDRDAEEPTSRTLLSRPSQTALSKKELADLRLRGTLE